ncbi:MAG: hypothetical protein C4539_13700 [Ignavibacteriales bacterium]|nr:MAG: hypothetical protein C4539_13700 [Ignavibacteriales bacterium]
MKKIYTIILMFLLVAVNLVYASGGNRNGTGGAAQLLIPTGPKGISLGGSNVSFTKGIDALYWNPAGLSRTKYGIEATFSQMSYIADIGVSYGAVSTNVEGVGMFALSIKALAIGEIDVTTTEHPDGTGQTYSPQMLTAGLSFARNLSDRISVGLTANLITEKLGLVSATGFAFNIGVMYTGLGGIDGLSFGLVMKNIGPQMQYEGSGLNIQATSTSLSRPGQYYKIEAASFELPSSLEFGVAYNARIDDMNSLMFSTTFQNNNFAGDNYKLGAEYTFSDAISVRGGYTMAPDYEKDDFIYGLTAGIGGKYDLGDVQIKVDYAYRDVKYFDGNHVFGISFGF